MLCYPSEEPMEIVVTPTGLERDEANEEALTATFYLYLLIVLPATAGCSAEYLSKMAPNSACCLTC
jgi:hypothetical protein